MEIEEGGVVRQVFGCGRRPTDWGGDRDGWDRGFRRTLVGDLATVGVYRARW